MFFVEKKDVELRAEKYLINAENAIWPTILLFWSICIALFIGTVLRLTIFEIPNYV